MKTVFIVYGTPIHNDINISLFSEISRLRFKLRTFQEEAFAYHLFNQINRKINPPFKLIVDIQTQSYLSLSRFISNI